MPKGNGDLAVKPARAADRDVVGTELNAERQWRPLGGEALREADHLVGTELNAERQWRHYELF